MCERPDKEPTPNYSQEDNKRTLFAFQLLNQHGYFSVLPRTLVEEEMYRWALEGSATVARRLIEMTRKKLTEAGIKYEKNTD